MSFFSVIIPVYNCEKYLTDAVNSVRRQPVKDIEIILVDDGSTDSSGEICLRLADEDKNIKVFSQINKGASAARNTGLDHAAGEYVMFLDADDIYVNNAVDQEILNECRVNNGELVPSARSNCTTLPKQEYRFAGWLYR